MKTARALRLVRRLKTAEAEVSDWEGAFLESVEGRLGTYGRAFADPEKGSRDSALSTLQHRKLREIGAKLADADAPVLNDADDAEADGNARASGARKPAGLTRRQPKPRKPWPRRKPPRRAAADEDDDAR